MPRHTRVVIMITSAKEEPISVRSVYSDVAGGAVLIARVRHVVSSGLREDAAALAAKIASAVMTFKAKRKHDWPAKQARIHRPMRIMAGFASVHSYGSVLKYERTALLRVTFEARLFVRHCLIYHARASRHSPGGRESAVGIVAIGAGHESLVDTMFEGHRELGANAGMASVAQFCLIACQQKLRDGRLVNGMTIRTYDVVQSVRGATYVGARQRLVVAAQAIIKHLLWLQLRKSDDRFLVAAALYMGLSGAMTALAPGFAGRLVTCGDTVEVRILVEL